MRSLEMDDDDEEAESTALRKVVEAFRFYKRFHQSANDRRRKSFASLFERQKGLLPTYMSDLRAVDQAIEVNAEILELLVQDIDIFENTECGHSLPSPHSSERPSDSHMSKTTSVIQSIVREWSKEGRTQREASYGTLLNSLEDYSQQLKGSNGERSRLKVLIPGCGLGRLAWEVAAQGHCAEGNEFSYFMLIAGNFILNRTSQRSQFVVYPSIASFSNIRSKSDLLHGVYFPDICPNEMPPGSELTLSAGDFVEIYEKPSRRNTYDAILTSFFIDTAKNIIEYVEIMANILKPGGLWANCGPLLYHWENDPKELSIELTLEDVMTIVRRFFDVTEETTIDTSYTEVVQGGMLRHTYSCAFWKAIKKP